MTIQGKVGNHTLEAGLSELGLDSKLSLLHILLVDFGWLVTILEMGAEDPWQFTWSKFC